MTTRVSALFLAMALAGAAAAADPARGLPEPVVPLGLGCNIHFVRPDPAECDTLASVGYRFIRMDFSWGGTERRKGEYDFAGYDQLVAAMSQRNIRCLFILDYGNRLYDEGVSPHSEEAQDAFARWAGAAARHYAGKGILWEIWNEPNIPQFWKPKPNAEDYSRLALKTIAAIRAADPDAFILAPASSGFPWEFFQTMADRGVFAKLDAVSVHPYRQVNPETATADYQRLRLLVHRAVPGRDVPIVSGEWGYSTGWKNLTEELQSQYIARQWLTNLANDVRVSIWYDWRDDGLDPKEPEHHFGSVYRDLKLKPTAIAAQTLCRTLDGYRFIRRIATASDDDHLLMFAKEGRMALAAWTAKEKHAFTVPLPAAEVTIVSMLGERRAGRSDRGLAIEIDRAPQYILVDKLPEAARYTGWRPAKPYAIVRAGEPSELALVNATNAVVTAAGEVIGRSDARGMTIRFDDASKRSAAAVVHVGEDALQTARIDLLIANSRQAMVLPPSGGQLTAVIDNACLEALDATVRIAPGGASAPLKLERNQRQAIVSLPLAGEAKDASMEVVNPAGHVVLRARLPKWRTMDLPADAPLAGRTEGDAKVAGSVSAKVAAPPPGLPQPGIRSAVRIDYRFGPGWRYAMVKTEKELRAIEGMPVLAGMWVHGDGSGNILRCRIQDSAGQVFQPTFGPIDWTGWKWVTMPLGAHDTGHWGGPDDGVIRPHIQWETLLLIDNAREKVDQDLTVHVTPPALMY